MGQQRKDSKTTPGTKEIVNLDLERPNASLHVKMSVGEVTGWG